MQQKAAPISQMYSSLLAAASRVWHGKPGKARKDSGLLMLNLLRRCHLRCCCLCRVLFAANLTANLTVNQLAVQVSTLADLAQSSAYFGVPADSSIAVYFTSSMDKSALLLRPRMVEYKRTEDGVEDVRRGKIAAFVSDHVNALHFTQVCFWLLLLQVQLCILWCCCCVHALHEHSMMHAAAWCCCCVYALREHSLMHAAAWCCCMVPRHRSCSFVPAFL
jgi:hypothetical protein